MRCYSAVDDQAVTASPGDTVVSLTSAATIRPAVYELILGTTGTPGDQAIEWQLRRFDTADGTGDALAEQPVDPADPAALATAKGNHTVEPTYGSLAIPLILGIHQRATFHWRAMQGRGIKIPAVATEGVGIVPFNASYIGLATATMFWEE